MGKVIYDQRLCNPRRFVPTIERHFLEQLNLRGGYASLVEIGLHQFFNFHTHYIKTIKLGSPKISDIFNGSVGIAISNLQRNGYIEVYFALDTWRRVSSGRGFTQLSDPRPYEVLVKLTELGKRRV